MYGQNFIAEGYTVPTHGLGGFITLGAPELAEDTDDEAIGAIGGVNIDRKSLAMYGGGAALGLIGLVWLLKG